MFPISYMHIIVEAFNWTERVFSLGGWKAKEKLTTKKEKRQRKKEK